MKISILGCGTYGSAIKNHLIKKGHTVVAEKIEDADFIFVSVPSHAVVSALLKEKDDIKSQPIIIGSKGLDESGRLLSKTLEEEFSNNEILFLYGPALARGIEKGDISAMVLAGRGKIKEELKKEIESENLIIELSDDIIGVQVGASLKNVATIFNGIVEGAGYSENTRAFVFVKGIEFIQRFGVALGANANTFIGLTCVGDLTLNSRNRRLGFELGKGRNISEFEPKIGAPQEGIFTLKVVKSMLKDIDIDSSFIDVLYSIIFEEMTIAEGLSKIK